MQRHLSIPPPLIEDDDESPSDSSHSTPHSSVLLHIDPFEAHDDDDFRRRRHSLFTFDSGYFSTMGIDSPIPKSSHRFPPISDSRNHLNGAADALHASPKREGAIMNFLRKRKKSAPFASPSENGPSTPPEPVPDVPPLPLSPRSNSCDPSVHAFEERDRFVERRGMKHHPYSRDDAPYMLAYDRTLLDNDRFSEILLRRLNPNRSPSFHDFSHAPPRTILDLGCGPGGWALEAAAFWPSSQVIGFDLLHPVRLRGGVESPSNVQWKQGNFVKYKLPFPKNTFDLVRMANLSLCVPHERWEHVMSEARRVLNQGGRLELIDDYLYFPYSKRPPQPRSDSHSPRAPPRVSSSFVDSDDEDNEDEEETETEQTYKEGSNSDDEDDFVSTKSRFSSFVDMDDPPEVPPSSPYDPVAEWSQNVDNSKALEKLFEDMLATKFSVHPRPSKFFDRVIDKVFGRYHQSRLHEFNLYLAPPSSQDSDGSSLGGSDGHGSAGLRKAGKDFAKWVTTEWDNHKERQRTKGDRSSDESLPNLSAIPDILSAKAAGRLGIRAAAPPRPPSSHTSQSPGLILWPATFIPMSPFELEMHACKHIHSLLGSKAALNEFLQDVAREKNLTFDQRMVNDAIWDYESFRRKRFNWPSDCADSQLDADGSLTTPRSNTFRNSCDSSHQGRPSTSSGGSPPPDPLFPRDNLDFVRSIRVYGATKVDEEIHVL